MEFLLLSAQWGRFVPLHTESFEKGASLLASSVVGNMLQLCRYHEDEYVAAHIHLPVASLPRDHYDVPLFALHYPYSGACR